MEWKGILDPRLSNTNNPPDKKEIIKHFRGKGAQIFFKRLYTENLQTILKM